MNKVILTGRLTADPELRQTQSGISSCRFTVAIDRRFADKNTGVEYFNVGTGVGYSVLDIVKAYEAATGIKINYKIGPRRPGDIDECYANPEKAYKILGWKAENTIEDMCKDAFNWQTKNPNGYEE